MDLSDPLAALQQQANQAGSQAAQGAVQQFQTALPGLVDAAGKQASTVFQGLIAQASQGVSEATPGLVAQAQQAASPAAYALGQQAGAGAASGMPDPTTVIVVAGVAVVGLVALASYLGAKRASRVNALSEHRVEAPDASQVAAVRHVLGSRLTSTTQGLLALAEIHERDYEDPVGAGMLRSCADRFAAHDAEGI